MKLIKINNSIVRSDQIESVTSTFYPQDGKNPALANVCVRTLSGAWHNEDITCKMDAPPEDINDVKEWSVKKGQEIMDAMQSTLN